MPCHLLFLPKLMGHSGTKVKSKLKQGGKLSELVQIVQEVMMAWG